ncbi:hypothetical protein ACIRPK_20565 [Kitasatospora sp. NPDC101801]|uniref:hypothetical protein n=1 Tax=Kitasatospora sp. NPDC101801 TaxID=3364103 RepID=UPI00380C23D8
MRPPRFEALLVNVAKDLPGVQRVATLAQAEHTAHPNGIAIQFASGAQFWWQITAVSAPGDVYSTEEGPAVTGPSAEPRPAPDLTAQPLRTAAVEEALAAAVAAASDEVASVDTFSNRTPAPAIGYGLAVRFHNGATIFVNGLAHVRAGATRPSGYLNLPAV